MVLKPLTKPFKPAPQRASVPVERLGPTLIPTASDESASVPREAQEPAAEVAPAATEQATEENPKEMSFKEVCGYLDMRPRIRHFYANSRGQFVRELIEEHVWIRRPDGEVTRIPKWFIGGEQRMPISSDKVI